jgi:octaprenyl-diphosphate synthase
MADEKDLGKKLGKDLEEGKITLPLICLLRKASQEEQNETKGILKSDSFDSDALSRIVQLLEKYRALEESLGIAEKLVGEAREELSVFADSPERQALLDLADYALSREK